MARTWHILAIAVFTVGFVTVSVFAQDMGFYSNKLYDFSFNVPTDWNYYEDYLWFGTNYQVILNPNRYALSMESPHTFVKFENIAESKIPVLNAQEIEKYELEYLRTNLPDAKIIYSDVKNTSWGWIYSVEFVVSMNIPFVAKGEFHEEDKKFYFKNRESYFVGYLAPEIHYQRYYGVFLGMLETLKIKGIEVTAPPPLPIPSLSNDSKSSSDGGCLIATATFGTELAPQVQQLRELRDDVLLQTESGAAFMSGFNEFYYIFSPTIADWERQNPIFKEAVKIGITPLLNSLTILNYVGIDSEAEVLGYGISLILLNIGMYIVAPVGIGLFLSRRKSENSLFKE
ncbi:MAG: CFI-box-CTERM domain-containing protein [Nitrosopumilaceae archaeon]